MIRDELKTYTLNLKSLDQKIDDPIVAGSGDVYGYTFRIIFTQIAAKQFAENTKVYLNWHNLSSDTYGYNVFTKVKDNIWEINYPAALLAHEGKVLARIELVDNISIAPSTNFTIQVLKNPNNDSRFDDKDDYSIFSQAVLELNSTNQKMQEQLEEQQIKFNKMLEDFKNLEESLKEYIDSKNQQATEDMKVYIETMLELVKQ